MTRGSVAVVAVSLALGACSAPAPVPPFPGVDWVDATGEPVDTDVLALFADDCEGRETAAFLDVLWPLSPAPGEDRAVRRYVRDPEFVMPTRRLFAPYDPAGSLPPSGEFTGFVGGPFQLWVGADDADYIYLVDGPRVEALPRAVEESVPC